MRTSTSLLVKSIFNFSIFILSSSLFNSLSAQVVFYGMTSYGGSYNSGAIFSFNPATNAEADVHNFPPYTYGTDGAFPVQQSFVPDTANGLFYAITQGGGSGNNGAIISYNPSNSNEDLLHSFSGGPDAVEPRGNNLVYDPTNGLFYGMSSSGGNNSNGVIFSLNPSTNAETVLYTFGGTPDAAIPTSTLVYNTGNGLFYGTTAVGGANNVGCIFTFNPSNDSENVLYDFQSSNDGEYPGGLLTYNTNNGLYYGLTSQGGTNSFGTVFSFNPSTNAETVLYSFGQSTDGEYPTASLAYDAVNGWYYGTTDGGGVDGNGTIFGFNPVNNTESAIYSFGNSGPSDGAEPTGNLAYDNDNGLYYLTTYFGGTTGAGTIISYNPVNNSENVLYSFIGGSQNGQYPGGDLVAYPPFGPLYAIPPPTATNNVLCNNGNTGIATATTPTGGTTPYTYSWSPGGGTSLTNSNLSAGTYTVTVTDAKGATVSSSVNITQPASALSVSASILSNVLYNGGTDGSASSSASGGTSPYTYSWSNEESDSNATGLKAGSYTITVSDNNGCTASTSVTITQPSPITISSTQTNVTQNGGDNGSATASASGGTSPYTYSWSNGETTSNDTGLTAGSYTITVTDMNGATASASVTITQPSPITISSTQTNVTQNGGDNGSATASASGGTSPYTYSWSNGETTSNATGLTAGSYTITVTDKNGSTASTSVTITQPSAVTISTTQTNVTQNGGDNGSATASASGGTSPYTYSWSNGETTSNATGLKAGGYTITVTDKNGSTASTSVTITQPSAVTISTTQTNVTQNGGDNGSATASASGGTSPYTYSWSNGETTSNATGLKAGSYTITVTDKNGSTASTSVTITQPSAVTISTTQTNVTQNGGDNGSATASASGGTSPYTYSWSNGETTSNATGLKAGSYTITVTDKNGSTASTSVTITQPAAITTSISVVNVSACSTDNGSATLTAGGGTPAYTYKWGSNCNSRTTATITGLSAGTYTVTVTDSHGSSATASVAVVKASNLTASATVTNVSCHGGDNGTATAGISGGTSPYTYSWSNKESNSNATGLSAGTYTVTVTDARGCTVTAHATISQPASALTASASVKSDELCNGGNSGSASSNVSGGTSPYTYSWNNKESNSNATGLTAGSYTITVLDKNGCTASASVTITQPACGQTNDTNGYTDFNSTPDCNSATLWLNMHIKLNGELTSDGDFVLISGGTLTLNNITSTPSINNTSFPEGEVIASSSVSTPVTRFDDTTNMWITEVPLSYSSSEIFISGGIFNSSSGFMAGKNKSSMVDAYIYSDVTLNNESWFYGLSCYQPAFFYDGISSPGQVTAIQTAGLHSGTPIPYKSDLVSGGSGGGGSNYTGSFSSTINFTPCYSNEAKMPVKHKNSTTSQCCPDLVNINLYPNPNTGQFNLSGLEKDMILQVYDYTGKEISTISVTNETMQLNIYNQPDGIYLIRILDKNGNMVSDKKVVLQK